MSQVQVLLGAMASGHKTQNGFHTATSFLPTIKAWSQVRALPSGNAIGSSVGRARMNPNETSSTADLAQSVERAPFKRVAVGSSPTIGNCNLVNFYYFFSINKKIEMINNI